MSIRGEYRYQTHLSIVELTAALGVAEGLRGQVSWANHNGYGAMHVSLTGVLLYRLCDAVGSLLPRKGFKPRLTRWQHIGNCVSVEEALTKQVPEASAKVEVYVMYTKEAGVEVPLDVVFANGMCCSLKEEEEEASTDLLGWYKHLIPCLNHFPDLAVGPLQSTSISGHFGYTDAAFNSLDAKLRERLRHRYPIERGTATVHMIVNGGENGLLALMRTKQEKPRDGQQRKLDNPCVKNFPLAERLSRMCVSPVLLSDDTWVNATPYVHGWVKNWLKKKSPLWEKARRLNHLAKSTRNPVELVEFGKQFLLKLSAVHSVGPIRAAALLLNALSELLPRFNRAGELETVKLAVERFVYFPSFDFPKRLAKQKMIRDRAYPILDDHLKATAELQKNAPETAPPVPVPAPVHTGTTLAAMEENHVEAVSWIFFSF